MEKRMILDQLTKDIAGYTQDPFEIQRQGSGDTMYPATNPNLSYDEAATGNYQSLTQTNPGSMPASAPQATGGTSNAYSDVKPRTPPSTNNRPGQGAAPNLPSTQAPQHSPRTQQQSQQHWNQPPQQQQGSYQPSPSTYQPTAFPAQHQQWQQPPASQQYPHQAQAQAPTRAPQQPQTQSNEVSCPACTFINGRLDEKCVMCGTPLK